MKRKKPHMSLALALTISCLSFASPAAAAPDASDMARLQACIAKIDTAPEEAFEDGLVWRSQSGGTHAEHCIALARIGNGDVEVGATRLAALAQAPDAGDSDDRALLLAKAANAWMLVPNYDAARNALDAALRLKPDEVDLLIDRARALAGLGAWQDAQSDLTRALSKRPRDGLILRLRAETHIQLNNHAGAQADVTAALALNPKDIDTRVMAGRVREAQRLGRVPD
ncbi:MAG: hypothetical protein RL186_1516 [Pseudomonadota bacterium]|jgi:tetratricopeptide (TPR) repeat protein